MKSYISRKLPLTTRNTDFAFDSFARVACDGVDTTISKKRWPFRCWCAVNRPHV